LCFSGRSRHVTKILHGNFHHTIQVLVKYCTLNGQDEAKKHLRCSGQFDQGQAGRRSKRAAHHQDLIIKEEFAGKTAPTFRLSGTGIHLSLLVLRKGIQKI
jgi:hypothetical protein